MADHAETGAQVGQSISSIGKLEPFDLDHGSITEYLERAELCFSANSVLDAKQIPAFLNLIGASTYASLQNFLAPH